MNTSFTQITNPNQYVCNGGREGTFPFSFHAVRAILGEPFRNDPVGQNANYPDDDYKTDVCWCVKSETGKYLTVWNYKSGPAYNNGEGSIEELEGFSVWYEDKDLFDQIYAAISEVA